MNLDNKKILIIGDRDGIPGQAIEECLKGKPVDIILSSTECFVWTAAGAMDLENQRRIKDAADKYGADDLVVILGGAESDSVGLAAETVMFGDPTYAGALTGTALNLHTMHATEPYFKDYVDPDIYEEQVGMMEMVLDVESIAEKLNQLRSENN